MLKKEARKITGGLSAPNKMPGPSINLPAWNCKTGVKLQAVKGSVCAGCYAMKGRYRFSNVREAMDKRLAALADPRWVDAMVTLISGEPFFRWHDSGDIQSIEHLENIFRVCRKTPETQHWMPTREAQFIKRLKVNQVPRNLIIRMSSHMIDQGPVSFWPWTSTVVTSGKSCPAQEQGNQCKNCRACWDRSVKNIAYPKH
tara:strand:- start:93 stop:692 length:600 start_codon:yes stop_codon:yes gene_type:complete